MYTGMASDAAPPCLGDCVGAAAQGLWFNHVYGLSSKQKCSLTIMDTYDCHLGCDADLTLSHCTQRKWYSVCFNTSQSVSVCACISVSAYVSVYLTVCGCKLWKCPGSFRVCMCVYVCLSLFWSLCLVPACPFTFLDVVISLCPSHGGFCVFVFVCVVGRAPHRWVISTATEYKQLNI